MNTHQSRSLSIDPLLAQHPGASLLGSKSGVFMLNEQRLYFLPREGDHYGSPQTLQPYSNLFMFPSGSPDDFKYALVRNEGRAYWWRKSVAGAGFVMMSVRFDGTDQQEHLRRPAAKSPWRNASWPDYRGVIPVGDLILDVDPTSKRASWRNAKGKIVESIKADPHLLEDLSDVTRFPGDIFVERTDREAIIRRFTPTDVVTYRFGLPRRR